MMKNLLAQQFEDRLAVFEAKENIDIWKHMD